MEIRNCLICNGVCALVNLDKLHGRVGMTYGWVHTTRRGRIISKRHAPEVRE